MKAPAIAIIAASLSLFSHLAFAEKYLGHATPQEKDVCQKAALWMSGSNLKCFANGRDLVIDPSVSLEQINRIGTDPTTGGNAQKAIQRVYMTFKFFEFRDEWMKEFDSVTVRGPRADLCKRMDRQTWFKADNSDFVKEWRAAQLKLRAIEVDTDPVEKYFWDQAQAVPCPANPALNK